MIQGIADTLDFHARSLVLRAERQRVIAGNIANADTPGYQARDFDFAAALREANGGGGIGSGIATDVMSAGSRQALALKYALPAQTNLDGNTVDMDRERGNFADNAVKYESTLRFINGNVRSLLDAMKSHTQA